MIEYKLTRWQKIYYPTYRFARKFNPRDRYFDVKHLYQRANRGWSFRDTWSMDSYLAEIIPKQLRHLADTTHSYPGLKPYDSPEKWEAALRTTADDIEQYSIVMDMTGTLEEMKIAQKRVEKGMSWIAKNFFDLWD